ncbi:hypothetical protein K0M31_019192 [Melipona bicolor]|uniref:Uncharacterized protein n=1 Tax=Melipona bicolor TaxID=60889 RepID=A0AA40KQX3_9HYME|nr:hypothetical protein K0M31_019192 [Melipona bicolor]
MVLSNIYELLIFITGLISTGILTGPTWFCQQDGICDKASAPSVSSISRLLRGPTNQTRPGDDPRRNHSIDGILGELILYSTICHFDERFRKEI